MSAHPSYSALGAMSTDDLAALAHHGDDARVRIAAELVHLGRTTAVPPHPGADDVLEIVMRHTHGGHR